MKLLKSAAVYGANASGKSNFIQAFSFLQRFVLNSSRESQVDEPIDVENFRLSTRTENEPSFFEVVFFQNNTRYRYGFEVDRARVHAEWLYHVPRVKETKLFIRKGDEFEISGIFREGKGLQDKTRKNALYLSVVAQFNGSISQNVLRWFQNVAVISGLHDFAYRRYTMNLLEEEDSRRAVFAFIEKMDLGFSDFEVNERDMSPFLINMPKQLKELLEENAQAEKAVTTIHKKFNTDGINTMNVKFDLESHESEGTKKVLMLSGPLLDVLIQGRILFIDELDARIHPLITSTIVQAFNSAKTNLKNAQLVFVTHDTNLLSNKRLRRDQIWFVEKDRWGASELYSLAEYKGVRNDASYERDYITGRYGAIPFLGNLEEIIGELNAETEKVEG